MTRSKLLEQTKVITDGNTAFSRVGFDSAIVIVTTSSAADVSLLTGTADAQEKEIELGNVNGTKAFYVELCGCDGYIKVDGATSSVVVLGDGDIDPSEAQAIIR